MEITYLTCSIGGWQIKVLDSAQDFIGQHNNAKNAQVTSARLRRAKNKGEVALKLCFITETPAGSPSTITRDPLTPVERNALLPSTAPANNHQT